MVIKSKKKKSEFSLLEEYKLCWNYIKDSKNFIYFIMAIFVFFILVGFFLPVPETLAEQIFKFIQELIDKTKDLSQIELIKFIFLNNIQSSFVGMLFGGVLGIFPIIGAIFNGYLIGFVAAYSVESGGFLVLLNLVPHGIFELPAIFLSLGLGLRLGMFVFEKNRFKKFSIYFLNSLRVFILIVLPLLIIAALIEGSLIFLK